jgi:hypothetical protein
VLQGGVQPPVRLVGHGPRAQAAHHLGRLRLVGDDDDVDDAGSDLARGTDEGTMDVPDRAPGEPESEAEPAGGAPASISDASDGAD